jgi:hypothetical protein
MLDARKYEIFLELRQQYGMIIAIIAAADTPDALI